MMTMIELNDTSYILVANLFRKNRDIEDMVRHTLFYANTFTISCILKFTTVSIAECLILQESIFNFPTRQGAMQGSAPCISDKNDASAARRTLI